MRKRRDKKDIKIVSKCEELHLNAYNRTFFFFRLEQTPTIKKPISREH